MAKRAAIRREGDDAENRFLNLVESSRKSEVPALGDAIVTVDQQEFYVEIKQCAAQIGASGTINQVRPIKSIPCAIWASARKKWYIFSGKKLIDIASEKPRGHHNEIAFECMTLSLRRHQGVDGAIECTDDGLDQTVREAIKEDRQFPNYARYMSELKREICTLNTRYKAKFGK